MAWLAFFSFPFSFLFFGQAVVTRAGRQSRQTFLVVSSVWFPPEDPGTRRRYSPTHSLTPRSSGGKSWDCSTFDYKTHHCHENTTALLQRFPDSYFVSSLSLTGILCINLFNTRFSSQCRDGSRGQHARRSNERAQRASCPRLAFQWMGSLNIRETPFPLHIFMYNDV